MISISSLILTTRGRGGVHLAGVGALLVIFLCAPAVGAQPYTYTDQVLQAKAACDAAAAVADKSWKAIEQRKVPGDDYLRAAQGHQADLAESGRLCQIYRKAKDAEDSLRAQVAPDQAANGKAAEAAKATQASLLEQAAQKEQAAQRAEANTFLQRPAAFQELVSVKICETKQDEDELIGKIRKEKANYKIAGVVDQSDLRYLHSLQDQVVEKRELVAMYRRDLGARRLKALGCENKELEIFWNCAAESSAPGCDVVAEAGRRGGIPDFWGAFNQALQMVSHDENDIYLARHPDR